MKKTVTLILATIFAMSPWANAAMAYRSGPWTYDDDKIVFSGGLVLYSKSNDTYYVIDATEEALDEDGTLVVPSEIDGKKVVGFEGFDLPAKHIILTETVTSISSGCGGEFLESINLDPNRAMFLDYCGIGGKNLKTFTADGKNWVSPLWTICSNVFSNCGAETIILDRSLKSWYVHNDSGWHFREMGVFNGCESLRTVYMTDNVTSIFDQYSLVPSSSNDSGNFANCTGLDYLCFPESIVSLGATFSNCTSLRTAVFPAKDVDLTYLLLEDNPTYNRERSTFLNCHKLTIFGKAGTMVEDYAKEAKIPFIGSVINNGEASTVVAQAAQTATVWLNGYEIPAYTVNGSVYVGESALKSFGFGMDWDGEARTTTITKPENVQWSVEFNTNPEPYSLNVYSSDVKFMMNGFPIPYLCVGNGESIVDINALAEAVLY